MMEVILGLLSTAWGASVTTTTLFATVIYFARRAIIARINASIKSEYDQQLSELNSKLRKQEQKFKTEIEHNSASIGKIQSIALEGASFRQGQIFNRQITAIEELWKTIAVYEKGESTLNIIERIDFSKAFTSEQKANVTTISTGLKDAIKEEELRKILIDQHRPFMSDKVWDLFSVYRKIILQSMGKAHCISNGHFEIINETFDKEALQDLIKILPRLEEATKKYGSTVFPVAIDIIKENILDETRKILQGTEETEESISQAAYIQNKINSVGNNMIDPADRETLTMELNRPQHS